MTHLEWRSKGIKECPSRNSSPCLSIYHPLPVPDSSGHHGYNKVLSFHPIATATCHGVRVACLTWTGRSTPERGPHCSPPASVAADRSPPETRAPSAGRSQTPRPEGKQTATLTQVLLKRFTFKGLPSTLTGHKMEPNPSSSILYTVRGIAL